MRFKKLFITLATGFAVTTSANLLAYNSGGNLHEATVISATPVYRTVRVNEPIEQCWDEKVRVNHGHKGSRSGTPVVLGAILGAAVGNKFGSGRGRDAATIAGAILGGSIGRDVRANHHHHHGNQYRYERRCELVDRYHTEERIDGYDVKYRYNGQVYHTHTDRHPGDTLTVSVNVVPVE